MKKIILILAGVFILNTTWGQVNQYDEHRTMEYKPLSWTEMIKPLLIMQAQHDNNEKIVDGLIDLVYSLKLKADEELFTKQMDNHLTKLKSLYTQPLAQKGREIKNIELQIKEDVFQYNKRLKNQTHLTKNQTPTITNSNLCNYKTIDRPDGTQIIQYQSFPVAQDFLAKNKEMGLSIATNGSDIYLCIVLRFKNCNPQKIQDKISISLKETQTNNSLYIIDQKIVKIANEQVIEAVGLLTPSDIQKMIRHNLGNITYTDEKGIKQIFMITQNVDILKNQILHLQKMLNSSF